MWEKEAGVSIACSTWKERSCTGAREMVARFLSTSRTLPPGRGVGG